MYIETAGFLKINGIDITPGARDYPGIDPSDELTALQLRALRNVGVIKFGVALHGDVIAKPDEKSGESSGDSDSDSSDGSLSGQEEDSSIGRGKVSERRDSDDKPRKVRGKGRKSK